MMRFLLIYVLLSVVALSAAAFEAVSANAQAHALLLGALPLESSPLHDAQLERAAQTLETSWARPAEWRPDAAETLSAIYAERARSRNDDPAFLQKSVRAATRAVSLSPVLPRTWTRLAAFAQLGVPNSPCDVASCLAMSWRAGRMTDPATGCTRLRIANAAGLLHGAQDERIRWYVASNANREQVLTCLDFLPRRDVFALLLDR